MCNYANKKKYNDEISNINTIHEIITLIKLFELSTHLIFKLFNFNMLRLLYYIMCCVEEFLLWPTIRHNILIRMQC